MKTTSVYRTIREARNALALDRGYDPFCGGGHGLGRCTIAALAALGYRVDPQEWRRRHEERKRREQEGLCRECGRPAVELWGENGYLTGRHTGLCTLHTTHLCECDAGHRWKATGAEINAGSTCPRCGDYPV